jgi:hypothetical protein
MADPALDNAKAKRAAIKAEIAAISAEIDRLVDEHRVKRGELEKVETFIAQWHEMAGLQLPAYLAQKERSGPRATAGKAVRPRNPNKEDVARRCVHYIRKAGRPLMRKELMELLNADRVQIKGTDPLMVLSTMLWRCKPIIRRLPGGGYWPTADGTPKEVPTGAELPALL